MTRAAGVAENVDLRRRRPADSAGEIARAHTRGASGQRSSPTALAHGQQLGAGDRLATLLSCPSHEQAGSKSQVRDGDRGLRERPAAMRAGAHAERLTPEFTGAMSKHGGQQSSRRRLATNIPFRTHRHLRHPHELTARRRPQRLDPGPGSAARLGIEQRFVPEPSPAMGGGARPAAVRVPILARDPPHRVVQDVRPPRPRSRRELHLRRRVTGAHERGSIEVRR